MSEFPNEPPEAGCVSVYGYVNSMVVAPFNSNMLFANVINGFQCPSGQHFHSFKAQSKDRGATWKEVEEEEGEQGEEGGYGYHFDATFPDRAFAFSLTELEVLTKKGEWELVTRFPKETKLLGILEVPGHPESLYALDGYFEKKILFTSNFGKTWSEVPLELHKSLLNIYTVDDGTNDLLGVSLYGVYRYNSKQGWTFSGKGLPAYFYDVAASGQNVFGILNAYFVLGSSDHGANWKNVYPPADKDLQNVTSFSVDPYNPAHLFVSVARRHSSRLLQSTDGGSSWRATGKFDFVLFAPSNREIIYAVKSRSGQPLYKSVDGGKSFHALPMKIEKDRILRMKVDENNPSTLYFVTLDAGLYRSTDGGTTARLVTNPGDNDPLRDIASLPNNGSFLAIAQSSAIYKTTDSFGHWQKISEIDPSSKGNVQGIRLVSGDNSGSFFAILDGRLFETTDAGSHWSDITKKFGRATLIASITDSKSSPLYVATNRGIFAQK